MPLSPAIPLLTFFAPTAESQASLREAGLDLYIADTSAERASLVAEKGDMARAVLTRGSQGITAAEIAAMPKLEIICAMGVGYEHIDVAAARSRGISVTHGPGTNAASVADHAMALLLAAIRDIPRADAMVRQGLWRQAEWLYPTATGKRMGILGLGSIGMEIARRAAAGFSMEIAYHNRKPRPDVPYRFEPSLKALAEWCDILMIATPGGPETRHLIDADILQALGPKGYLVNIARGSVVDTAALVDAAKRGAIAMAALDVVEREPDIPADLIALPNVVLTPHMAGRSPDSVATMTARVIANLTAHFSGQAVPNPVPGS